MLCLKERRLFDGDGGGGGGGGDAADAAAEGVGGGTGVGGTATASEAAGGAIGGDIGAGSAATAAAAADPSLGFGVPGIDPSVGAVDPGMSAADIGFSASDIGAVGGIGGPGAGPGAGQGQPGIVDRTRDVLERTSPISNPNIANFARVGLGLVNPMSAPVTALGLGYQAITGREAISQTAAEAVGDQEATAAEAGAGDIAPYGNVLPFGGGLAAAAAAGQAGGETGGLPSTPAYQRPARLDIPPELLPYLNPGMNDLQLRSAISTGALYNANPAYRSQGVQDFYNNLVARSLIDDSGNFRDMNEILPVEQQYASQSRGAQGYQPNAQSFLQALGAI